MLTWQYAKSEEFLPICELFSVLDRATDEIQRRVTIPLLLNQLITFYKDSKLCGFITFAFLNDEAEKHMPTVGILPNDWRSGSNFWAIDFVAKDNGYKMLRVVTKALGVKSCRYFRHKQKIIKEVRT